MWLNRLRLVHVLGQAAVRQLQGQNDPYISRIALTVRWSDCDINRHMNNSRYALLMDLGRWDLLLRTGKLKQAWQAQINFIAVDLQLTYRKALRPGQHFILQSTYAGIEGKKIWFDQRFIYQDKVVTQGWAGVLMQQKGRVAPLPVLESFLSLRGIEMPRLTKPPY